MQTKTLTMMNYSRLDDTELAKEASHDIEAFSILYERYVTFLYRYLYSRLGNARDAEDLTAQVFMDALEGLDSYHENGHFASWLFTIAHRRLVDHYRQYPTDILKEVVDGSPDPHTIVEDKEMKAHLVLLISKLDEERQEVLRLRFVAGLAFSEIAVLLKRSEGAVKMTLYRTLDWLNNNWEKPHE